MEDSNTIPKICPSCHSSHTIKDGSYRGTPGRRCGNCEHGYGGRGKKATDKTKRTALHLYLEGLGYSSIARVLGFGKTTIYRWIKKYGENLDTMRPPTSGIPESAVAIQLDGMWRFVKKNPENYGFGLLSTQSRENRSPYIAVSGTNRRVPKYTTRYSYMSRRIYDG